MSDASLELQKAVIAALKADATLNGLVAGRIYDQPPANAVKPYVSLGAEDWANTEGIGEESHSGAVQIDAWSTASGKPEAKRIAGAIQDVLHEASLVLDTQLLVLLVHRVTRYFVEADGLTKHAAMDFRANTQQP